MPVYTYRREDGSTFDVRQRFLDSPLEACPSTGQPVSRVIQPAGIIFKGSGFYVNDSNKAKNAAKSTSDNGNGKPAKEGDKKAAKAESKSEGKGASEQAKGEKAPASK